MKIAVAYENGQVFQHFGHTQRFKIYNVEQDKVVSAQVVDTNGSGHGALADFLKGLGVDALICGGIGSGARQALNGGGIRLYGGVTGETDKAVEALLAGNLQFDPNVKCNHHNGQHHHGDYAHSGSCGTHGCGGHMNSNRMSSL